MFDILLIIVNNFPVLSIDPIIFPKIASKRTITMKTLIQTIVNAILLLPLYNAALLPITPIVSKIACGLSNETDKSKTYLFHWRYNLSFSIC